MPPAVPTVFDIKEQVTGKYTATITDDVGAPIPAASLLTLTLTLYVIEASGTVSYVNSRNAQNVLNTNDVAVSVVGLVTWSIQPEDTTLVEDLPFERHIALWEWTWTNGAGKQETVLNVQRLTEV